MRYVFLLIFGSSLFVPAAVLAGDQPLQFHFRGPEIVDFEKRPRRCHPMDNVKYLNQSENSNPASQWSAPVVAFDDSQTVKLEFQAQVSCAGLTRYAQDALGHSGEYWPTSGQIITREFSQLYAAQAAGFSVAYVIAERRRSDSGAKPETYYTCRVNWEGKRGQEPMQAPTDLRCQVMCCTFTPLPQSSAK